MPDDRPGRRPTHWTCQARLDLPLQDRIGRQPDGAEVNLSFRALVQVGSGKRRVTPEKPIAWSRDDLGHHAAVGYGIFPDYFSQINTFATDGSGYWLGPDFGPNEYYGGYGYPLVEPGDLAIMPVPEPASLALVAVGLLLRRR